MYKGLLFLVKFVVLRQGLLFDLFFVLYGFFC